MKKDTFNFALRMPPELGDTIFDMAIEGRRPMNTQIVLLLEYAIREKSRKRKKNTAQHNSTDPRQSNAGR